MSVQTQIDRISGAVSDALAALTAKGVTVPTGTKVDGLADLIAAIESGGLMPKIKAIGFITPAEDQTSTTINTGVEIPNGYTIFSNEVFFLWKNTNTVVNGSYVFLYIDETSNGHCFSYGYRPGGSVYNSNTSTIMSATSSRDGMEMLITVTGSTTGNYTYGLVAGVEYGWCVAEIAG